ncbi:MAG: (2Fe-2S) ferredoxin domain-containing protein [Crinalium sp.]
METGLEENSPNLKQRCVLVCQYRSCLANNSAEVLAAFQAAVVPEVTVIGAECQGQCSSGATVRILPEETWYYRVKPSDVSVIVEQHLKGGKPVEKMLNPRIHLRFSF